MSGVFSGIALYVAMEAKGLDLTSLGGWFTWITLLAGFLIVYFIGALITYPFSTSSIAPDEKAIKTNKKSKTAIFLKGIAVVLKVLEKILIVVSVCIIIFAFFFEGKFITFESYKFQIEAKAANELNSEIDEFQIDYDFKSNIGQINFELNPAEISYLLLSLPKELKLESPDFIIESCNMDWINTTNTCILRPTHQLKRSEELEIKFSGKLSPNAEYHLPNPPIVKPKTGSESGAFFKFYLDEFYCEYEPCYEGDFGEVFHYSNNTLRVTTQKTNTSWENLNERRFHLNYNRWRPFWYNVLRN